MTRLETLFHLADTFNVRMCFEPDVMRARVVCYSDSARVTIPKPDNDFSWAAALHEFGHVATYCGPLRRQLLSPVSTDREHLIAIEDWEVLAWQWAFDFDSALDRAAYKCSRTGHVNNVCAAFWKL